MAAESEGTTPSPSPKLRESPSIKDFKDAIKEMGVPSQEEESGFEDEAPIVRMCNAIIATAIDNRASEIRVEPTARNLCVRLCVDGQWQVLMTIPKHVQPPIINRYKVMADIPFWRKGPQIGRIPIKHANTNYDVHVSGVPSLYGDTLTLRIVPERSPVAFGLSSDPILELVREAFGVIRPGGILWIAGPANSGKTATAFLLLHYLNKPEVCIATIEDQPGYRLSGVTQSYRKRTYPVSALVMTTELTGMHLRGGVDTLFVDSVCDIDSAEAVVSAAESGLRVMATLTTVDFSAVPCRLQNWGISPGRAAATFVGAFHQRLVRRICDDCRIEYEASRQEKKWFSLLGLSPDAYLHKGEGCETCHNKGYVGRVGVYGLVRPGDTYINKTVLHFRAMELVRTGATTLEEVIPLL
jgi:type IV pilus assembly protein PilB